MPILDIWRGIAIAALLAVGMFAKGAEHWLQMKPYGENLVKGAEIVGIAPLGLITSTFDAKRWNTQAMAFFHEIHTETEKSRPWHVLQRTLTHQGNQLD